MLETHGSLIMVPSEIRCVSEGLNAHRVIIIISSDFGDAYDAN